jgi:hypothetical protein
LGANILMIIVKIKQKEIKDVRERERRKEGRKEKVNYKR